MNGNGLKRGKALLNQEFNADQKYYLTVVISE